MPGKKKKYNARFPPARIKKIMQSDEDVGKVAAAVPVIISRALELFVENMLKKANEVTSRRGARTLTPGHLKFCINSESRFDFLKELVSGVPDLQGDMDINLDAVPTVSEPMSGTTPSPLTTSSLTNQYSGVASSTLPSNVSATSAVATSSSQASSVAISTTSISQQFPKSSFKNSTNKNNNTSSSRSNSFQNDTNHKSRDDSLEAKESLNTKVARKRGRPRKSSSDASNKPKKLKTAQENNKHGREIIPDVHATQYSLNSSSDITLKTPDVEAEAPRKSLLETALIKPSSKMSSAAERLRQISRTYSTGSLPSNNSSPISSPSSAVPSFTLTFPIIPQNSEPSQNKAGELKNNSSSQTEKLKNNSKKGTLDIYAKQAACKDGHSTSSNNGFPFTISNILEKEHNSKKQIVETDKQLREDMITHPCTPLFERKNDIGQNNVLPVNSVENEGENKNSQSASEKTSIPTVSWTMNVVAPKINTSEEIDEDYDA